MKKTRLLFIGGISLVYFLFLWAEISNIIPSQHCTAIRILCIVGIGYFVFKKSSLPGWIFVAMIAGIEAGNSFPEIALPFKKFSDIFLRLIKTIIAPLIFSTLVVGIAGHSNLKQTGRLGLKAMLYFTAATFAALMIGIATINFTQAGIGAKLSAEGVQTEKAQKIISQAADKDPILNIFPENIAKAISEGQVLQVVVFSILFAIGLGLVTNKEQKERMLGFCESLASVMFKFTDVVMYLAPFAVGGALAYAVAAMGVSVLKDLLMLVMSLYLALIVFIAGILLPLALIFKIKLKPFLAAITEPVSIAFATATSEAALPKAMENLEKLGVPRKIVSFVLPAGYSFNLDGSTLYLSLASVFIAQASGIDLTLAQQIQMCLVLMITSKGVAGVRGASFLILVSTIESLGLDAEKAFAILAVDAIMDMGRTTTNVIGNCLATVLVARWEKEY